MSDPPFTHLELQGVSKVYGRHRALADVSLTLQAHESVALLGPNGAGKSTLVGILSTLISPSSGHICTTPACDLRQTIGMLAHESFCYGDLSGSENVEFFARLYGVPSATERTRELIERVGLSEAAARPARTYSRGMLQRLALARALVHRPRLLLCDEPFSGLDRSGIERVRELLDEERRRGALLVVVTHDFDAAAALFDRVIVLSRGRVTYDAPAPASRTSSALGEVYRAATAPLGRTERPRS